MDSDETLLEEGTSPQEGGQEQPQFIEINGEQVSLEEAAKGYMRQSDYSRKTQELAQQRKALEQPTTPAADDEDAKIKEMLKGQGFVTKEDMEREKAATLEKVAQDNAMEKFFDANPELSKFEKSIRTIAQTDNRALEDIVVDYNFTTTDKVRKAKSNRAIVGDSNREPTKEKTIDEMNSTEFAEWKKKNVIKKGSFS